MSTTTTNYGLIKPELRDAADITQTNGNWDKVDNLFKQQEERVKAIKPEDIGAASSVHGNHVPTTQTADKATFLRNDNTWQKITPSDIGAANIEHGIHVPAVQTASNSVFLRNDNTWQTVTPSNIGAVPSTRKVNGRALSADITLSASDVNAVPTTCKVNGKALSTDITLSASDIGAAANTHNQAASTITGGTFNGQVNANQVHMFKINVPQLRDIYAGTNDLTAGVSALTSGQIYLVYE